MNRLMKKKTIKKSIDNSFDQKIIEFIVSDKPRHTITLDFLEKFYAKSLSMKKLPFLIVAIPRNEKEIYLLKINISLEKK
jgi:hypothetical protein